MIPLRPDCQKALRFFGAGYRALISQGSSAPVLVGGAAVEIHSNDLIATVQPDLRHEGIVAMPAIEDMIAGRMSNSLRVPYRTCSTRHR